MAILMGNLTTELDHHDSQRYKILQIAFNMAYSEIPDPFRHYFDPIHVFLYLGLSLSIPLKQRIFKVKLFSATK